MAESQPAQSPVPEAASAPAPVSGPASASSPAPLANEGELQPPQHWIEQPLDDDGDGDSALGDDAASSTASISSSILAYRTINGRTYHSDCGDAQYWGANDDQQNETLDIMHHTLTLAMDGKLHYAPLPDDIKQVVDIGTGTGVWAIDFGDMYPDAHIIGTDLSPIQPSWVPPNVHFQIDDFTQEWTFAKDSLDFVHMRWLVGCVTDWTALFKQAYNALKPGGWVETYDCNGFLESDDGTVTEKSATAQWGFLFREGGKKSGNTASYAVVRDGLQKKGIEEAGFTNIHERTIKVPTSEWPADPKLREVGKYCRVAIENDIEGIVGYSAVHLGWSKPEISVYAAHMRKDLRNPKVHSYCRYHVVWAQKPLTS